MIPHEEYLMPPSVRRALNTREVMEERALRLLHKAREKEARRTNIKEKRYPKGVRYRLVALDFHNHIWFLFSDFGGRGAKKHFHRGIPR